MNTTAVAYRYSDNPAATLETDRYTIQLPLDGLRSEPHLDTQLNHPALIRDSLLTLAEILDHDLRRQPQDRSDYLAYLQSQGKAANKALWEAQKAFLETHYGEAVAESAPLDPLLTVYGDSVSLEVFSRDEATYARLDLDNGTAFQQHRASPGTSHFRFDPILIDNLKGIRDYRTTQWCCQPTSTGQKHSVNVPYRWLRAFGQVQTAATLTAAQLQLMPIDLYNILQRLRLAKAKKPPRALRYELVPGEPPRIVLEPWEWVITATGPVYNGPTPRVVRTWGRQRLGLIARLLPHLRHLDLYLLGPGLPSFYRLDLGSAALTLSLSGWTDSGWAGIATFDLLVPDAVDEVLAKRLVNQLQRQPATLEELVDQLGQPRQRLRQALLQELLRGSLVVDIANRQFRHRPLVATPLDLESLRYRDPKEAEAHRLLANPKQVQLNRIHDLGPEGTRIDGEIGDPKAHRRYQTTFTLDREGRTAEASCSCRQFRRSGLKEGPCPHMMALRIHYGRHLANLEAARQTPEGRQLIHAETRLFSRRQSQQLLNYRVSLDDRQVVVRWGENSQLTRFQRLLFANATEARNNYFLRLEALTKQGFIDASNEII